MCDPVLSLRSEDEMRTKRLSEGSSKRPEKGFELRKSDGGTFGDGDVSVSELFSDVDIFSFPLREKRESVHVPPPPTSPTLTTPVTTQRAFPSPLQLRKTQILQ